MSSRKGITHNYDSPGLFTSEMLGESEPLPADGPAGPIELQPIEEPVFYISFGSGSSGNCAYVGDRSGGFLIDAGIDAPRVESVLKGHGIPMTAVRGVVLTHDHGDHVRFVYQLLRNNRHMLVYCTPKMLNGMLRRHSLSRRIKDYHRAIYKEFEFRIGNFVLIPFETNHDGTDNCGFFITHGQAAMAIATDLGEITERVAYYMKHVNYMVIESNYDREMLLHGAYPDHLKARIAAPTGHLDNAVSSEFVASVWTPRLSHVFLCHLSHDNNKPEVARLAHVNALQAAHPGLKIGNGDQENLTDMQLIVLPRYDATPLYVLRPRAGL